MPRDRKFGPNEAFLLGLSSGAALVLSWRPLFKQGIKTGMRGAATLRRAGLRGVESLIDIAEEARWELVRNQGSEMSSSVSDNAAADGPAKALAVV